MTPAELDPLLDPLLAVQRILDHFGEQGIIIGGVAASLVSQPRLTADIDAMILLSTEDIPHLIEVAQQQGVVPRNENAAEFARLHRVLLMRHLASGISIDISLGILPFEVEAVERSISYQIGPVAIRLPTAEDLIIMKAVAHRPKDLLDIQTIIQSHPSLDRERIEYWVRQFAEALELPELWDDISHWL